MRQKNKTIVDNSVSKSKKASQVLAPTRKNSDSHRITERHELMDGAVTVIRTTKSGNFWSMSCWLREERKCYRRSLHTKNLEEAKAFAREEYIRINEQEYKISFFISGISRNNFSFFRQGWIFRSTEPATPICLGGTCCDNVNWWRYTTQ